MSKSTKTSSPQPSGNQSRSKNKSLDGYRASEFNLFLFPYDRNAIPEDFLADEETGLRLKQTTKPSGVTKMFLDDGIKSSTVLPPAEMWNRGYWFVQLSTEAQAALQNTVTAKDAWNSYVVQGEGTPGNFNLRIYVCPDEIAEQQDPPHPLLWPEKLRTPKVIAGYSGGYSAYNWQDDRFGFGYQAQPAVTQGKKVAVAKADPLPTGIRFRCTGCGHWFKEQGLAPHTSHCCPGKEDSGESDWAILCECCLTLDQVAACKPGFPRPKKKEEVKETTETKQETAEATVTAVA